MGWAVVGLDVAMVVSFAHWVSRPMQPAPKRVLPVLVVACLVQVAHLAEEYRAGFQRAFPSLFGYVWEDWGFLAFNFAWLALFAASAVAIARGHRLGTLPAFFSPWAVASPTASPTWPSPSARAATPRHSALWRGSCS